MKLDEEIYQERKLCTKAMFLAGFRSGAIKNAPALLGALKEHC